MMKKPLKMTTPGTEVGTIRGRRILLAVDPHPDGGAAIHTAAVFGAAWRAEVEALFVEDINLLRLARLPFVRELRGATASLEPVVLTAMEQALRVQGERLRRLLAEQAASAGIAWSFTTARGSVTGEIARHAAAADLLVVSALGASMPTAHRIEVDLLQALLRGCRCPLLVVRSHWAPERRLVAVYEGGDAGAKVMDALVELSRGERTPALVLVPTEDRDRLAREVRARCGAAGVAVDVEAAALDKPGTLARLARVIPPRMWLFAADHPAAVEYAFSVSRNTVLLVR